MEYENLSKNYKVTSCGLVFSLRRNKYLKQSIFGGYNIVNIGKKNYFVHRLVAITYIPNPSNLPCVNHKDGNKLNNHVDNLEWCTSGYNQCHAYLTGLKRLPKGEMNGRSVLTDSEVLSVYDDLMSGARVKDISEIYGVGKSTIMSIKKKESWQHLLKDKPDIKIKKKTQTLSENTVIWICKQLSENKTVKWIFDNCHKNVTINQIQDIKRRHCFCKISKDFIW
jgi:ribonuclease HI